MTCSANAMGKREVKFIILSRKRPILKREHRENYSKRWQVSLQKLSCSISKAEKKTLQSLSTLWNGALGVENGCTGLFSKSYLGISLHTHFVISSAFFKTDASFADYKKKKKKTREVTHPEPYHKKERKGDFPGGPAAGTLSSQCRGPGFNPWSGN